MGFNMLLSGFYGLWIVVVELLASGFFFFFFLINSEKEMKIEEEIERKRE